MADWSHQKKDYLYHVLSAEQLMEVGWELQLLFFFLRGCCRKTLGGGGRGLLS